VVCDLLQLDASTLSRNVERMVAGGWLEIVPDDDRRTQPFKVSTKGKRLIEQAFPAWQKAQQQATGLLGTNGVDFLRETCSTLGKSRAKR
jgi:DNA-binding MarR family transcriptional regulator